VIQSFSARQAGDKGATKGDKGRQRATKGNKGRLEENLFPEVRVALKQLLEHI